MTAAVTPTDCSPKDCWPAFSGPAFAPTRHLLHMVSQAIGKLKLAMPFQAQWAEVPLWLTARGVTTGPISYANGVYEVRVDLVAHEVQWLTSAGATGSFPLGPTSVADCVATLLDGLRGAGVDAAITLTPQEIADPIRFDADTAPRPYDRDQVEAWWRILLNTQRVMEKFQGRFIGKTQPIGLMWGTFDIRLALYNGKPASPAATDDYIRRNAMNAELFEAGWWPGDATYTKPAFYAFTYPQPPQIEHAAIGPSTARWEANMGEFLLDYDDLRQSADPDGALLAFLETTYRAGAEAAGWDAALLGSGRPA